MWQQHHFKAKDALRCCSKKNRTYTSIWDRWTNDQVYRESQVAVGWSDAFVRYLDHSSAIDRSHNATQEQRGKYSHLLYLRASDDDRQGPPLATRPGYKEAKSAQRSAERNTKRNGIAYNPKTERQRIGNTLDPQLQEYLVWLSANWSTYLEKARGPYSSSSSSQWSSTSWRSSQSWFSKWQE